MCARHSMHCEPGFLASPHCDNQSFQSWRKCLLKSLANSVSQWLSYVEITFNDRITSVHKGRTGLALRHDDALILSEA